MAPTRSTFLVFLAFITMVLLTISCPSKADEILEFDLAPVYGMALDSDITYAPEPAVDPALMYCASKITLDCASEVVSYDFFVIHFEAKCCKQLVRMGKRCNDLIIDNMLTAFDLKTMSNNMHDRSDHLWNKCLKVLPNC